MFWRFGEPSSDESTVLLYDEVRHRLRYGQRPPVRMPHYPALILSLLLRMQAQGRVASADQIRAFLDLPKSARVKGHVTELRKKLAEAGADPSRLLEPIHGQSGYRLSPGVHAGMLLEADAVHLLDEILASPEPVPPPIRAQLASLRQMLLVTCLVALAFTTYLALRPDRGDHPLAQLEEGDLTPKPRTLLPGPSVRASDCFELADDVRVPDGADLVLELSLPSSTAPLNLELAFEQLQPGAGRTLVRRAVQAGAPLTPLRLPASELDQQVRERLRRVCIASVPGVELRRVSLEAAAGP